MEILEKNTERDAINILKKKKKQMKGTQLGDIGKNPCFSTLRKREVQHWKGMNKSNREGRTYEIAAEMTELMNKNFQSVFTKETEFISPRMIVHVERINWVQAKRQERKKL